MKSILKSFFKNNNIEYENKKFILAVSTGIDSAVLLDAFVKLKKDVNLDIVIAHVNHKVRKQSDLEEEYIKKYAADNDISCFVKSLNFDGLKDNFESTARKFRYEFFLELMEKEKGDYLVLAHHGIDNIETILMRIIRGSSLTGYSGMSDVTNMRGYKVIRPLLGVHKDDIVRYQQENKVVFFEDETNELSSFTRNRIRKEVVPKLFEESNDLINKFIEFRKTIYEASLIVNSKRDAFINEHVKREDDIVIDRGSYLLLNDFMKEEVLFELLKEYLLSKKNIEELVKIIKSDIKNYCNKIKDKFNFIIEYDKVIVSKKDVFKCESEVIIDKPGLYTIGDKKVLCVLEKNNKNDYNLNEMWYNSNMLPLVVRHRKNGDRISVNGIDKKLKDLFIDMKIPLADRDNALLAVKDDELLMVFGIKKSDVLKRKFSIDSLKQDIKITILEEHNG